MIYDLIVVGSGIIGLSSTLEWCIRQKKKLNVAIIDRISVPGRETSSRNSGVLHAGLYYKKGSLKHVCSINGSQLLRSYCQENKLPLLECGKILVPTVDGDIDRLYKLYNNASNNGCAVELLNHNEASRVQPGLSRQECYLWSPKTAVFNPVLILESLYEKIRDLCNLTPVSDQVQFIDDQSQTVSLLSGNTLSYRRCITCAGADALSLEQRSSNLVSDLCMVPFAGEYIQVEEISIPIRTNIYPVPNPDLPFLGAHFTPTTNGNVIIGPNAIPILEKFAIGANKGLSFLDSTSALGINAALFLANRYNFRDLAISELSNTSSYNLSRSALRLVQPDTKLRYSSVKHRMGIRAQLVNKNDLSFVNDFIVLKPAPHRISIVNAVSPAFTSSLSLSPVIINQLLNDYSGSEPITLMKQ